MKINFKMIDWTLRHKIILHVFIIGSLTAVILTFLYLTTQRNIIRSFNRQQSELVGSVLESNIAHLVEKGGDKVIGPSLQKIATVNNVETVRILNINGIILQSSEKEEIGRTAPAEITKSLALLFSDLNDPKIFQLRSINESESFMAIENKPECTGCHSQDQKINGILNVQLDFVSADAILRKNQATGFIIAVLSLAALIFIILRLFEKIINRPLSQLKNQMKTVEEGNLDIRLQPKKQDEIGDLTRSFNHMLQRLREANHKIEEYHNHQIEKAGHLASLGELAAGLAHEIKNPVAGIKGALEIIADKTDDADPRKEIFYEVLKQTERIHLIIEDLLSYAKPREMNMRWISPNSFISAAKKLVEAQLKKKDIQILYFPPEPEDLKIFADENKLQEVILNLLLNSVAAINCRGEIMIHAGRVASEKLEIKVSDTGKGIKPDHLSRIFQPFFSTRAGGTGLGLSICNKIITDHNGSIDVESEPGKGTAFSILLPMNREKN